MANNRATEKLSQSDMELQATTLKVPTYVWRAVGIAAMDRKSTAQSVWIEAACKLLGIPEPPVAERDAA